jgi:plasmid stabilization system protein ParE
MNGYRSHPEAEADLDAIWEFIAEDSLEAADRMIEATIEALVPFPHQGHRLNRASPAFYDSGELSH